MKRRTFLGLVIGAGTALLVPFLPIFERLAPRFCVEAVRARLYPGPVRKFSDREMSQPGHWAG